MFQSYSARVKHIVSELKYYCCRLLNSSLLTLFKPMVGFRIECSCKFAAVGCPPQSTGTAFAMYQVGLTCKGALSTTRAGIYTQHRPHSSNFIAPETRDRSHPNLSSLR